MEKVEESPLFASDPNRYLNYLPQVCVARQDKISSKVRPVFDASSQNNQGISLNDNLYPGAKTQGSIPMITANLRVKPILLVADLSQMFYSIGYSTEPETHTQKLIIIEIYIASYGATTKMMNQKSYVLKGFLWGLAVRRFKQILR